MAEGHLLTGWGRTAPSAARVLDVSPEQVGEAVREAAQHPRGLVARGCGKSYGDAAQNAGGVVLRLGGSAIDLDEATASVTTSAGSTLADVIAAVLPRGYFPMTTPGTRDITLGGAVACDVHGKNHHRDGSFGSHVVRLELVGADGVAQWVAPDADSEDDRRLFWATVGGMGLTGVITRVVLRLRRVESAYIQATQARVPSLDALLDRMVTLDDTAAYTVAWVDLGAGRSFGRAVLDHGEHALVGELGPAQARDPLRVPASAGLGLPVPVPLNLVSRPAVLAFDELWYRRVPRQPRSRVQHLAGFFYPLDAVTDWNRLYGPRGLVQYQLVVPDTARDVLVDVARRLSESRRCSFLNVLKRLGPGNPGPLSFPSAGWTLAVDVAADPDVGALLRDLDDRVAAAGGRVYLAKDGRTRAAALRGMYPRLAEFAAIRRSTGAESVFTSDLSRRLDVDGGTA